MIKEIPCEHAASGFCARCQTVHRLGSGNSRQASLELMARLERNGSVDLFGSSAERDPHLSTELLFTEARGKMFGVLECRTRGNSIVHLYAFSGQYNGRWLVDGWVPPLFPVDRFHELTRDPEREIKSLTRSMQNSPPHSEKWRALRKKRRTLSQNLMAEIHGLYRLTNFRGETASLGQAFYDNSNPPTGAGDCCGPKLLNFAAQNDLLPLGLSEFYWGRENLARQRFHGRFYGSCSSKCRPLLGFMLCGLDTISAAGGCNHG